MLKKELEEAYNQVKEENKELRRQNKELLQKLSFYQSMDKSDSIKEITDRDKRYQYPSAYDTLNKEQKMYFKKMVNGDNIFLSGKHSSYSATIVGDKERESAYSTTSLSLSLHNRIPMLGFSFAFFTSRSRASR